MKLKRLKDLREDSDLTQARLAKYINITQRSYSHYENGDREIPLIILIKLADFYDTSLDYLVGRTDKKKMNK
ncbi:MAG: helix-turn-helix transcriptional regulator [Bacilli bacterium]|nr:helix-turn-helix transcriptional regulator [Bacilli bacterium]